MLGNLKLTKNPNPSTFSSSGCGIEFKSHSLFSYAGLYWVKNVVIFGVDNSSSVHTDNTKKKNIIGEDPTQGLDDALIMGEAKHSIDFSRS